MGRLIPAGTGLGAYKKMTLNVEAPTEEEMPIPPPPSQNSPEALALQDE